MNERKYKFIVNSARARHQTAQEMLRDRGDQAAVARYGKVGVYKIIGRGIACLLENHLDAQLVSSGGEQVVLRSHDETSITKVIIKTIGASTKEVTAESARLQSLSDTCGDYLGDHWLDTTFYASSLPRALGGRAVLARQSFVVPNHSFVDATEAATHSRDTEYQAELGHLVAGINGLYTDELMQPDVLGPNNLVSVTNGSMGAGLQFVDTIPKTAEDLARDYWARPGTTLLEAQQEVLALWQTVVGQPTEWSESQTVAVHQI